jgi:transcriptional regulator with XRE-family HTH domain
MQPDTTPENPKRQKALELIMEGNTDAEVASALGVDRSTVWRWRKEPHFLAELRGHRAASLETASTRLAGMIEPSIEVLGQLLRDAGVPAAVRVKAATIILDRAGLVPFSYPPEDDRPVSQLSNEELAEKLRAAAETISPRV